MQEDSFWRLCPVKDIDKNNTLSLLCWFKESLKHTMLEQASIFEDQIHELHRLYQKQKALMIEIEGGNTLFHNVGGSSISSSISKIEDESDDKSVEKKKKKDLDLDLGEEEEEEEEEGLKNGEVVENVKHLTGFSMLRCELDLNEPAKIEEPEAQDSPISTKSQAENVINLNTSPLSTKEEEEVITFKKIESKHPQEFISASLRGKQESEPSRAIVQALPCLKSISHFHKRPSWTRKREPRGTFVELKSTRSWTNTRKRRVRKPHKESSKVTRKIARTKSKNRGRSFLVTYDCISPLHWFAKIASSVVEDSKSEVGLTLTGFHSDYQIDYSEEKTLHQLQHEDNRNDAHSSYHGLMENTVIDWGTVRKRRRGNRVPATNTKTSISFSRFLDKFS